jgi:chromosome segregation ATPase
MAISDLSILVNAAEVMKNHFKAFQRIEEVLKAVQASETYLSELTQKQNTIASVNNKLLAERVDLQSKIDAFNVAMPKVEAETRSAQQKLDMDLANVNTAGAKRIANAEAEAEKIITAMKAKVDQEVRICQSRINDAQSEASEAETGSQNIIKDWESKIKVQEQRYQEVVDRLAAIKQSL